MANTALIVVDVQRDFCESGSLPVTGGAETATRITEHLVDHDYDLVVASKDWHFDPGDHWSTDPDYRTSWPAHCAAFTPGAEFHPNLILPADTHVVYKGWTAPSYSAFDGFGSGTSLSGLLHAYDIRDVNIVGIALDHCVMATALDAVARGFRAKVFPRLTASVSPDPVPTIMQLLRNDVYVD